MKRKKEKLRSYGLAGCFEQLIQPLWRNNRLAKCLPAAVCCYASSAEANSLQRRPQTMKVLGERRVHRSRVKLEEVAHLTTVHSDLSIPFSFYEYYVKGETIILYKRWD